MDYSELFEGARKQISIIPDEQIFLAKDLFSRVESASKGREAELRKAI